MVLNPVTRKLMIIYKMVFLEIAMSCMNSIMRYLGIRALFHSFASYSSLYTAEARW